MTPKEKAVELMNKMFDNCDDPESAIQCAIICVDEIVSALEITTGHCELRSLDYHEVQSDFKYWNEVKQELPKL